MSGPLRSRAGGAKRTPARYSADALADPQLKEAIRLHRAARYDGAVERYRQVIAREPRALDAWMNLGSALVRLGRGLEAEAAISRALELATHDARAQRDAASALAALGVWPEARRAYERALELAPSEVGARLGLARLCLETGDRGAAIEHARRAVAIAPGDASSWLELHRAVFDDRALGPAIDAADRALALRPDYSTARIFLGGALARDGARDRARLVLSGGALDPGWLDAIDFCEAHKASARATASTYETLLLACDAATLAGPVVELGVRHGLSTRTLAQHAGGHVHAFDSFLGLPSAWHDKPAGSFSTAGQLPRVPSNVSFHVGAFEDTLPPFAASLCESPRLVHVDSDLYESAATALRELGPRLSAGALLLFDEYIGNVHWRQDEHRAFSEAAARLGWRFEVLAVSWITGQTCIRLTGHH